MPFNKLKERSMSTLVELWASLNFFFCSDVRWPLSQKGVNDIFNMQNHTIDGTCLGESGEQHKEGYF